MNGQLLGQVVDGAGSGVADATVVVVDAPGPVPDIAAVTDFGGRFGFDGLPEGRYRLRAMGPDGGEGQADATVSGSDQTAECVIWLVG